MNQAVKIILTQMEIHPEDFESSYTYEDGLRSNSNKWEWMLDRIVNRLERRPEDSPYNPFPFLTDEEVQLIYGKFMEIQEGVFTRTVMKTMLSKPKPEEGRYVTSAGAASPVNPIPTPPKIYFDVAANVYKIAYPNGFTQSFPEKELEDSPDSVRDLVNSLLTKP